MGGQERKEEGEERREEGEGGEGGRRGGRRGREKRGERREEEGMTLKVNGHFTMGGFANSHPGKQCRYIVYANSCTKVISTTHD